MSSGVNRQSGDSGGRYASNGKSDGGRISQNVSGVSPVGVGGDPPRVDPLVLEEPPDEPPVAVVPDRGHDRRPDAQPRQPDPDVAGEATDEPLERHDVLEPDADLLRIEVGVQPTDDDHLGIGRHGQSEPASQARGLVTVICSIASSPTPRRVRASQSSSFIHG